MIINKKNTLLVHKSVSFIFGLISARHSKIINRKDIFGPIIVDILDPITGVFVGFDSMLYNVEREVLQRADGIVWRYFLKEYLEDNYGFKYDGKSLQFVDYCFGEELNNCRNEETNNVLRICSMPSQAIEFLDEKNDKLKYVHVASFQSILKRIGNRKDCLFHILYTK